MKGLVRVKPSFDRQLKSKTNTAECPGLERPPRTCNFHCKVADDCAAKFTGLISPTTGHGDCQCGRFISKLF